MTPISPARLYTQRRPGWGVFHSIRSPQSHMCLENTIPSVCLLSHSFKNYFLSTHWVLGTVLGTKVQQWTQQSACCHGALQTRLSFLFANRVTDLQRNSHSSQWDDSNNERCLPPGGLPHGSECPITGSTQGEPRQPIVVMLQVEASEGSIHVLWLSEGYRGLHAAV